MRIIDTKNIEYHQPYKFKPFKYFMLDKVELLMLVPNC